MKQSMLEAILRDVEDPTERKALQETWDHMKELDDVEPSPDLARRFSRTLEISRAAAPRPASAARRLLALAAVLVIGIAIGMLAVRLPSGSRDDRTDVVAPRADLARLSRAVSLGFEPHALAPRRLEAVEALAGLVADPSARRILIDIVKTDPSIDVRLRAIEAIEPYADDSEIARPLIETASETDSALVRIRVIEVLVDRGVDAALPTIRSLARDPGTEELVRETAEWASDRL